MEFMPPEEHDDSLLRPRSSAPAQLRRRLGHPRFSYSAATSRKIEDGLRFPLVAWAQHVVGMALDIN